MRDAPPLFFFNRFVKCLFREHIVTFANRSDLGFGKADFFFDQSKDLCELTLPLAQQINHLTQQITFVRSLGTPIL